MNEIRLKLAIWLLSFNKYISPTNNSLLSERLELLKRMKQCI